MPYQEVDSEGNPVLNDEGAPKIIEELGSWDQVQSHIPEDLKEEKMWANVQDVSGLLKSYAHAHKKMGSSINIPKEDSTQEEWDEYYSKLGRPDTPDDYDIEWPEREELEWDSDLQHKFKTLSHKIGLTTTQAKALADFEAERKVVEHEDAEQALNQAKESLEAEWGANYPRNLAFAQRAVKYIGGEELEAELETTGFGNNLVLSKALYKMGKRLVESKHIPGEVAGVMTAQQANSKIAEILSDASHPYYKGESEAVEEMRKLHQIAFPT